MPAIHVIHHANCADGFAAAWVARSAMKGHEILFHAAQHGQEPPEIEAGSFVMVLDFSWKRPVLEAWLDRVRPSDLVLLDHHLSAQQELAGLEAWCRGKGIEARVVFDMGKSGVRLAWEHFHGAEPSPWLVDYTEDRDLWRWKLPQSREINACIRSHPFDFTLWDHWAGIPRPEAVATFFAEGRAILRSEAQIVERHVANAREIVLDGYRVRCVNATMLQSEIAGELAKDAPFGACFFVAGDGREIWSLRSREGGVDVSEVARKRGGGGHRAAAGFQVAAPSGLSAPAA